MYFKVLGNKTELQKHIRGEINMENMSTQTLLIKLTKSQLTDFIGVTRFLIKFKRKNHYT